MFFELDKDEIEYDHLVTKTYLDYGLDYLIHKTGGGGKHYLSPTLISKAEWKEIMNRLRFLNKNCPMTTLRVQPNKYPNESEIWYRTDKYSDPENQSLNSREMCQYLNKIFKSNFVGEIPTDLKIVRYPLPLIT